MEKSANPLDAITAPKRKRVKGGRRTAAVETWSPAIVADYARIAENERAWREGRGGKALAWTGGSILVRLMWQAAVDSTDAIVFNKAEHLVTRKLVTRGDRDEWIPVERGTPGGVVGVDFNRGKTDVAAFIPLSADLVRDIDNNGGLWFVMDPAGLPYRPFLDDARLRRHMNTLRKYAVAAGAEHRVFDHLRHSAATDAEQCGFELDDVRHLTTHKSADMLRNIYAQKSAKKTVEIQRARGII